MGQAKRTSRPFCHNCNRHLSSFAVTNEAKMNMPHRRDDRSGCRQGDVPRA